MPAAAVAGWQHHPVSNRHYHFILPCRAALADPGSLWAAVEARGWAAFTAPANSSGNASASTAAAPGGWGPGPRLAVEAEEGGGSSVRGALESQDHLLHGLLHGNGFGHLLRMNGGTPPDELSGEALGNRQPTPWQGQAALGTAGNGLLAAATQALRALPALQC